MTRSFKRACCFSSLDLSRGPGFLRSSSSVSFSFSRSLVQLLGETQQPLALGLVGLGALFFIRLGIFVFLEDVAQVGLTGLDPLADIG